MNKNISILRNQIIYRRWLHVPISLLAQEDPFANGAALQLDLSSVLVHLFAHDAVHERVAGELEVNCQT